MESFFAMILFSKEDLHISMLECYYGIQFCKFKYNMWLHTVICCTIIKRLLWYILSTSIELFEYFSVIIFTSFSSSTYLNIFTSKGIHKMFHHHSLNSSAFIQSSVRPIPIYRPIISAKSADNIGR